jgi:uncharacterized protein (DUF488 family)
VERSGGGESEGSAATVILTVGHSTHPIQSFLEILSAHGVEQLADVRTIPKSRHNPQFSSEALAHELKRHGISYIHMPGLGGLRQPRKDSINSGWKNASFRGYADYMQTPQFDESLRELIARAGQCRTAIMCAEAVPWRCPRSLIADALAARGIAVEHVMSKSSRKPHTFTPFARIEAEVVTYPGLI